MRTLTERGLRQERPVVIRKRGGADVVKYSGRPGKPYPASIAHRQGIAEVERDLQTGKERFGKDLYAAIPNDPKARPAATVIIPKFTDKRPRVTSFDVGEFRVTIRPERKEIVYRRRVEIT